MPNVTKLSHAVLFISNLERSRPFYEKAFELKRVRESDVAIMLSDGIVSLAIIRLIFHQYAATGTTNQSLLDRTEPSNQ